MRRNCLRRFDAPLDEVAPLVDFLFDWRVAVRSWRDDGFGASLRQVVANAVAVVALVADELGGVDLMQLHQRVTTFDLMHLAAGHIDGQRIALTVRAKLDFRGEAAARAAERFPILIPPFAPAACWCA